MRPSRISDIVRKVHLELTVEWPMLVARKWTILGGLVFQYIHGIFGQLAHQMHRPMKEPLHDIGFEAFPELGKSNHWVSELLFGILFTSFILWSFSPFWFTRKRFYTFVLYARLLNVIVICQTLRILSFTSTQLPAPNYHCRLGEPTANIPMAKNIWDVLIVNVQRQSGKGCGDLIFSSHTTFALVQVLAYNYYGSHRIVKVLGFMLAAVLSCLIIASRKHYTVDITVAWYTVPLVFYAVHARTTNAHLRDVDSSGGMLPVTTPKSDKKGTPRDLGATNPLFGGQQQRSGSASSSSGGGSGGGGGSGSEDEHSISSAKSASLARPRSVTVEMGGMGMGMGGFDERGDQGAGK